MLDYQGVMQLAIMRLAFCD